MSSETNSGSDDAYGRAVGNAYKEYESASSLESETASSSSSESSRQIITKVVSKRRATRVEKISGKGAVSPLFVANKSPSNPQEERARSVESFVSHRLNADPPPIPAVIPDEIPMMKDHPGRDMHSLGEATTVSLSTLEDLARSIPWPAGIELCLPERGGTSLARYENCVVIFVASVEAGFRLPLPDFYRDFLRLVNLNPTQLYPNAWRYLSGYTMRCYHSGLSPDAQHMLKLFTLKYDKGFCNLSLPTLNVISKPSNVGKWKDVWFLARCSSHAVFNCQLFPGPFMRPDKPDQKEIDTCKNQFRNEGNAPDYKHVITQENLEKAGLSLPRSVRHDESGMKSDFLLKRAKKIASGSKSSAKAVEDQSTSEQASAPTLDAMIVSETTTSLLLPGTPVEAETRGDKRDAPSQAGRGEKRSRSESNVDPAPITTIGRAVFAAPVPSVSDMRELAIPNGLCAREKEWLASLSPQVLQLEGMKYMEMARLSMLAATSYCNVLDAKCKGICEEKEARTKVAALTKQVEQFAAELDKENANATKLEGEITKLEEEKAKLEEENVLMKTSVENLQSVMTEKDDEAVELKRQRDASNLKTVKWRARAKRAVSDYLKSEDYQMKLADEVGPHWEQGIRIGVRQAVARFGEIDPKIVYFTPDYTNLFGEPPIEDPMAGDNQAMDVDANVATNSATLLEDRDAP